MKKKIDKNACIYTNKINKKHKINNILSPKKNIIKHFSVINLLLNMMCHIIKKYDKSSICCT